MTNEIDYKFKEDKILEELKEYVDATYSEHYSTEKYQATDMIFDAGHGVGFTVGNVLKYAKRYGKKGTHADARKDLMKIIHYAMMAVYLHDEMPDQTVPDDAESEVDVDKHLKASILSALQLLDSGTTIGEVRSVLRNALIKSDE